VPIVSLVRVERIKDLTSLGIGQILDEIPGAPSHILLQLRPSPQGDHERGRSEAKSVQNLSTRP
jgi:hypothetical protein